MGSTFILYMSHHVNTSSVFVIVPAYNESSTVGTVVQQLLEHGYTPVVVDDGSAIRNLYRLAYFFFVTVLILGKEPLCKPGSILQFQRMQLI